MSIYSMFDILEVVNFIRLEHPIVEFNIKSKLRVHITCSSWQLIDIQMEYFTRHDKKK
jgi:hypothetical protein